MIRVFTYRRGCKVCPGCDKPLDGLRRDARGHDACMRAIRRRCTARASKGRVARQSPAQGHVCPGCGGDVLLVRVLAFGVLSAAQSGGAPGRAFGVGPQGGDVRWLRVARNCRAYARGGGGVKVRQHNSTLSVDTDKPLRRKTELQRSGFADNKGRRRSSLRKRAAISRASDAQREAVGGRVCLGCGRESSDWLAIDPAHLWSRGRGGCDSRFCVVPLCRDGSGQGCHRLFDEGKLDPLSVLVADWGRWRHHFQHALRHATPMGLLQRLAGARLRWEVAA